MCGIVYYGTPRRSHQCLSRNSPCLALPFISAEETEEKEVGAGYRVEVLTAGVLDYSTVCIVDIEDVVMKT